MAVKSPAPKAVSKPAPKPATKPQKPASKPTTKPASKPTAKPATRQNKPSPAPSSTKPDSVKLSSETRQPNKPSDSVKTLTNSMADAWSPKSESTPAANKTSRPEETRPASQNTDPTSTENVEKLRSSEVPENSINHPAGPAAAPVNQFAKDELNDDGTPKLGTTVNEVDTGLLSTSHRYVTVNELEAPDRAAAEEAFFGFNAPTNDALNGRPNDRDKTDGWVDPTAPLPFGADGFSPFGNALGLNSTGGHVSMHRGTTPEGTPWAINTTTPGRHPLRGHITRSLIEHNDRFYIRTEGVGRGQTLPTIPTPLSLATNPLLGRDLLQSFDAGALRDGLNAVVGPPTFHNLDEAANQFLRDRQQAN